MENLIVYETPKLRSPYLVAGFAGWPNAAEVSTRTISYLRDKLKATRFGEIRPENFYDFTSMEPLTRPLTVVEHGVVKEQIFPTNEFFYWKNRKSAHDLIIFLGFEPHLRWTEYADAIFQLAEQFGVMRIYTVGGTYDRVPHTKEPKISAIANDPKLKEELRKYDIDFTEYSGPSSIHTFLLLVSRRRNIGAISLWGHAPDYRPFIHIPANPKVCYGMLKILTRMVEFDINLDDMKRAGDYLDEEINKVVSQSAELKEFVRKLEEEYEAAREHRTPPEESDRIIRELEEFLKKEQKKEDSGGA